MDSQAAEIKTASAVGQWAGSMHGHAKLRLCYQGLSCLLARYPGTLKNLKKTYTEVDWEVLFFFLNVHRFSALILFCNLSRAFHLKADGTSAQSSIPFSLAQLLCSYSPSVWLRDCLQSHRASYSSHCFSLYYSDVSFLCSHLGSEKKTPSRSTHRTHMHSVTSAAPPIPIAGK